MRRAARLLLLAIATAWCFTASAVTWAEQDIVDPVDGSSCQVLTLVSSGSYIYDWPEKYDQVFIPVTVENGLWYCPTSGFASFIGDAKLGYVEKKRLADFLHRQSRMDTPAITVAAKLQRIEAIYALRDLTPERRILIDRILAYDFETLGNDPARATRHRQSALKAMLNRLTDESLPSGTRLEYLFVAANYLREFGDAARSDRLLEQLQTQVTAAAKADGSDYASYLGSLLPAARTIAPGGGLAPDTTQGPIPPARN